MALVAGGLQSGGGTASGLGPGATGSTLVLSSTLTATAIHVQGVEIKATSVPNTTDQSLRFMNSDNTIGWNIAKSAVGTGSDLQVNAGGTAHLSFNNNTGIVDFRFGQTLNTVLMVSVTAPTVVAGAGASVPAANGTAAFTIDLGGAAQTGTITLPSATTGWVVNMTDVTNNALFVISQTGGTQTTATFTCYSRTTGLAINWTANDIARCVATAY